MKRQHHASGSLATGFLLIAVLTGCESTPSERNGQRVYKSPEQAVEQLDHAVRANNADELLVILGPDAREVIGSGDPVADRQNRETFSVAMSQGWKLAETGEDERELLVGNEDWPFPIPLVREEKRWRFDTDAGRDELLARRIGRNELAVIGACKTYVVAQREYAKSSHDGKPAGRFARKVRSDAGQRNGLYWPTTQPADPPSPLNDFVANAVADGYSDQAGPPRPFHGYHFRVLTRQGASAPGGQMEYVVDGDMTGGFALIAHPVSYGRSGIMTFMVGPDGVVFESDLGPETADKADKIDAFDPDPQWRPAEGDDE